MRKTTPYRWCATIARIAGKTSGLGICCLALLLTGCESLVDGLFDMAFGEDMEITTAEAPPGRVGVPYRWEIYAEVKNDPFDGSYRYDWRLYHSKLPQGLSFSDEGDNAVVEGTPEEAGIFDLTLYVSSPELRHRESFDENSSVWSSSDTKTFTLVILPRQE